MPWSTTPIRAGPQAYDTDPASKSCRNRTQACSAATNSITFETVNDQGLPYGATVRIQFVEAERLQTYTVTTDAVTGIGTFTFKNFEAGGNIIELDTSENGIPQFSDMFIVFVGFLPGTDALNFSSIGQTVNVSSLGQNALPATDVPASTYTSWANAVPWMPIGRSDQFVRRCHPY